MNVKTIGRMASLGAAAAILLAVPAHVGATPPLEHSHENFSESFTTSYCGIDGTSVVEGVDNYRRFADLTFIENFRFTETFTATESQKSIVIRGAYQFARRSTPTDNGDGTLTYIVTFKGLYEQLRLPRGPVLSIDAGSVTIANTFDDGGTGNLVSSQVVGQHGQHPDLLSDFVVFCDVAGPALT